jgi:two-component system response regulator NreC
MAHLQLAPSLDPADHGDRGQMPIRVLLADDHAAARRTLRLLLDAEADVSVIAEADDLTTVAGHISDHRPQVLVIDLQLPNGSTIDTIRGLRSQSPATALVVLTMEDSPAFAHQALDAGAVGFVLKDHSDSELPEAVRLAARDAEYVSPQVAAGLDALRRGVRDDGLSPREIEVLRLIALGHTSAEVASRLHLSRRTVETYRSRIYRKLGLQTRAELVRHALRGNLIGS